jgi:RHS repeat-associated protein
MRSLFIDNHDYYTFGAPMPGRQFNSNTYKYGMNGQEKDPEIAEGIYTAEYWEYDSRIGRRWNTDPIVKPWESPYACFANNPIWFSDVKGDDATENGDKGKGNAPKVDNTPPKMEGMVLPEVTVTDKHPGAKKIGNDFKKLGNWIKDKIDYITSTGNYGTGHGGNGMGLYSSTVKRMSNALAELAEMFGVLKPSNADNIGTKTYKPFPKSNDKGLDKGLEEARKQGAAEQVDINNKKTQPVLRNFGDTTVETNYWDPNGSNSKFYTKDVNGTTVAPATETDKVQYDSQPH